MKILKNIHRRLMIFIDGIDEHFKSVAQIYGISVFKKTRFSSHIVFLRDCLEKKVIPKGFLVSRNTPSSVSGFIRQKIDKALSTCSRKIMKSTLHHFSLCFQKAHQELSTVKGSLHAIEADFVSPLKKLVFGLNKELYNDLKATKDKKLKDLLPVRSPAVNAETKTVVTIPEDLALTDEEKEVLGKGLNFVPAPRHLDKTSTLQDLDEFYRRIKLHAFFNDPNQAFIGGPEEDQFRKYKPKNSSWVPPTSVEAIENFILKCRDDINHVDFARAEKKSTNLTQEQQIALQSLKSRNDIIIKKADKGGAVVVWRKDLYIAEAERQLSDETFYEKVPEDKTQDINDQVYAIVEDEIKKGNLPKEARTLIQRKPRCGRFYLLPKIHKPSIPGRPVVSTCSFPTSIVSQFLDEQFQPIVSQLDSFVKDTTHFLNIIDGFKFNDSSEPLLFTMDVKSLYTVIPNDEGLVALKYFLDKRPVLDPPTNTLVRLAELVLNFNHFEFNGDYFNQIRGVAMGTRMGPSYACLFMGYIEELFHRQFNGPIPVLRKRFIDDIFGATTMSEEQLLSYIEEFNSFNPSIKFTHEISRNNIAFLDVTLKVNTVTSKIDSSIYYKSTDSHAYLQYDSYHPKKCKDSIPYSQFLRLRRICSDDDDFEIQAETMSNFFEGRGYPKQVVNSAKLKVMQIPRTDALRSTSASGSAKLPLILTFHSVSLKIANIINRNVRILKSDESVGHLFDDNIITAFKNPPNISSKLVRSKLESDELPGTFVCNRPRCKTCAHIVNTDVVNGPRNSIQISNSFSCTSKGLIYGIVCTKCGELYIGETDRMMSERFREHLFSIRHAVDKPVAHHFNLPDHNIYDVGVFGVKYASDTYERRRKECKLINHLGTLSPFGMNLEDITYRR